MAELAAAIGIGLLVGAAGEALARLLKLWRYRHPGFVVLNVLAMFGLTMGALSLQVPRLGLTGVFLAATAIGLVYEWLNLRRLHWWHFPGDRFLAFRGQMACAIAVATLWGVVPIGIHVLRTRVLA